MVEEAAVVVGDETPWFYLKWFLPNTFENFDWAFPLVLYLLPAVPLLFLTKWLVTFRRQQKLDIALTKTDLKSDPMSVLRFVPGIFLFLTFILLILALARPQKTNEKVEQWTEGIDIMLVVDISESMQIQDFEPNRLEAAKQVARDFVSGRFQDRIGLVVFSGEAFSMSPLTTDYDLLNANINTVTFELIESRGTAIGSALAVGTNRMRESESQSKVLILLSDGDNTAGNIDPITAAELASAYNIRLYTIAVGKEGRVPFGTDFFGRTRFVENTIDETTLREIARIGEGKFYRATDNDALERVFQEINELEKAEIKTTRFKDTTDFYTVYLKWAIVMLLVWLLLKSSFMSNILTD